MPKAYHGLPRAHTHVGASYADLGATITGPHADLNLGIKTFLNGALVSNIVRRAGRPIQPYGNEHKNGHHPSSQRQSGP